MRPVLTLLAGCALYAAAGNTIPFNWTHRLSESCFWLPVKGWDAVGLARGDPSAHDNVARVACMARRGGYGVEVINVLPAFPDRVVLASIRRGE